MKVRIGIGTGTAAMTGDALTQLVDDLESNGFDSLWWSDVLTVPGDDPLAAMAYAAGHSPRLKIGTTMVLPGRNPVRLAKQLATLDRLSGGRFLVTFVLGLRRAMELDAMGVGAGDRGRQLDELLPLLRRLWSEDDVDHDSTSWPLHGITVEPKPMQRPFDIWLGGNVPGALRRCGLLGDGWLPALCTPEEAAAGREVIENVAAGAGRRIDPEHFGVSIGYTLLDPPEQLLGAVVARHAKATRAQPGTGGDPDTTDVRDLVPVGVDGLRRLIGRFVDLGFSKFVLRPLIPPTSFGDELKALADGVLDLQS
ncbi:MAG TPA: LLM class flavin-dependent oxidoreductase [Acidimicrobiales bacterium]|nr:LLM class flavin-dependent oxidoreductase [Acidimicrobiales bacterium]